MKRLVLTCGFVLAMTGSGSAATVGEVMNQNCPDAKKAGAIETRASTEYNLANFDSSRSLYKESARIYLSCSKTTNNKYAHDWYLYFYASDLYLSTVNRSDPALGIAELQQNELAAATPFDDVRRAALSSRDGMKALMPGGTTPTDPYAPIATATPSPDAVAENNGESPAVRSCLAAFNASDWPSVAERCSLAQQELAQKRISKTPGTTAYYATEALQAGALGYEAIGEARTGDTVAAHSSASASRSLLLDVISNSTDSGVVKIANQWYSYLVAQFSSLSI